MPAPRAVDPSLAAHLRRWRATLHASPELAFHEFRTQAFIAQELRAMDLEPAPIAGTGLQVDLGFGAGGPCVAFRTDMDALPFPAPPGEDGTAAVLPIHACGHDMHMAILLGLAHVLHTGQHGLRGTVRLLFQPAEEVLARDSGAARCIAAGVLRDPPVRRIYALHVTSKFEVGTVACRPGVFMAESHKLRITVTGGGGHGAAAAGGGDPLLAMARILLAVQREAERLEAAEGQVSFCQVAGGTAPNVRPVAVTAHGTLRSTRPGAADALVEKVRSWASDAAGSGVEAVHVHCEPAYPLLSNSAGAYEVLLPALAEAVGEDGLLSMAPSPASEDFAFYLQHCSGAMFLLGVRDAAAGSDVPVHCAGFRGSDDALEVGVRCFEAIARRELGASK